MDRRSGQAKRDVVLVVSHSRTGSTQRLTDAAVAGARRAVDTLTIAAHAALDTGPEDVLGASAILIATPARFGAMAGLMKDFFERIYHPCLDRTMGMPYALIVKGDTDADGAVTGVERIATGLRWRAVLPPLVVVGPVAEPHLDAAAELGATLAAGVEAGVF